MSDIVNVLPDRIQPTPEIGWPDARDLVRGVIAPENQMISVLAIEHLLPERIAAPSMRRPWRCA